jgi:transcriptional regulator with GAF, ATPase, and Fis domain
MNQDNTILIVDDEKIARDVLKGLLINQGYNLEFATNGVEGLEKAKEFVPDLILLDVMMADLDGYEVCRKLRNDPILAEVPIIMITNLGEDKEHRLQGIEAGADDFIDKDFDTIELQARIRTIIRLNRYRRFLKISQELESKNYQLSALYDITKTLNSGGELDVILKSMNQKIKELMNAELSLILFYDNEAMKFYIPLLSLEPKESAFCSNQLRFSIATNIAEWVFQEGNSALIYDLSTNKKFDKYLGVADNESESPIKSVLCVPLQGKKHTLGVIEVINKKNGEFSEDDKLMLENISSNIAVWVERANFYDDLQKAEMLLRRQNAELRLSVKQKYQFNGVIGISDSIMEVLKRAEQVAVTDSTVLIYGETGTGKELLAQSIHQLSPRSNKTFVPINCGAIPKELLESELFGHEKGSFTGAIRRRIGRFEEAHGGTLFLDEIGDMPLELQVRLLRVLQEGIIQRLGGNNEGISVDVRIIAATHRNLEELVVQGRFRSDLYYRLKVFELQLPPLRERKADIPLLISHFIDYYNEKLSKRIKGIDDSAMEILYNYEYPGNVRELQHIIESAMFLCKVDNISINAIPAGLLDPKSSDENKSLSISDMPIPKNKEELRIARIEVQERVGRLFLENLLSDTNGNVAEAARKSGMNRSWLTEMISKHGLNLDQYRNGA